MTISAAQQTELEGPTPRQVFFGDFQFAGGTSRLSTWNTALTWGGFDWSGLGQLVGIDAVEESRGLNSKALKFTLTAAEQSWIALAVGSPEECRGRTAKLYMCPLDEKFRLVGTPELCWIGTMDPPVASISEDGDGVIILNCETSVFGLRRSAPLRANQAQQKKRHPEDGENNGFQFHLDLIAKPQLWASKKFQASQI